MAAVPTIVFILIFFFNFKSNVADDNNIVIFKEDNFQNKISEFTNYISKWLEDFNDKHLGNSEVGRILGYKELKPTSEGKSMKKIGMSLLPLVFHVGAASTWMLLTSIMAVKSVLIGLALLVFKIAVSSAKVASFFTLLKAKNNQKDHHDYSWTPVEHHGHTRSLKETGSYYPTDWNSYMPEYIDNSPPTYKTIPIHKRHHEATLEDGDANEIS